MQIVENKEKFEKKQLLKKNSGIYVMEKYIVEKIYNEKYKNRVKKN